MLQHIRIMIQVTWRRCDNVPGTSCKLLVGDLTTYQERVARRARRARGDRGARGARGCSEGLFSKMLQRIRNVLQVTCRRRRYDVAGTSCLCVHRNMNGITPPHPTPAVTDHERAVQCECLQDSKKDDEVAVPDSMSQPHVPKCYPKGMILWCSKWSTILVL